MATDGVEEGTLGTKEESWFGCPDYPNTPVMIQSLQELQVPDIAGIPQGPMLLDLTRQPIQVPSRQLTAVIQPGTVLRTPYPSTPGKEWVSSCPQALGMSFPTQAQFTPARGGCRKGATMAFPVLGLPSHWRPKGDLPSLTPPHSQTSAAQFLPQRDCLSCSCFKSFMKDSPCVPGSCQTLEMGTKSNIRPGTSSFMCLQVTLKISGQGWKDPHPTPPAPPTPRALKLMPTIHSLLYTAVATYCF